MLRYLRENTGNWIIKIFLFIIVIVFVFLGVGSMNATRTDEVAVVNDQPITLSEYQDAYKNTVQMMRQQFGNNLNEDLLKALNVKQQALNSLIDQRILLSEAAKLKIVVSDEELQQSVLAIKAFQRDGAFDLDLYKRILGQNGMSPEMFEVMQRQALKENKLRDLVVSSVMVTDAEARNWYLFENTQMAIDYIEINPAAFTEVTVSDEEIDAQYTQNPDLYQSQPQRKVEYLVFAPEDYAGQAGVTDEQVAAYYEQNKARFETPEQVEASHVLIRLEADADDQAVEAARKEALAVYEKAVAGEAFDELAKTFSQGPSAPQGGYLGTFERQAMVKPFADAAFSMTAGEISEPVQTQFGWHVIKVISRSDAKVKSLADAADTIKKDLEKEELANLAYYKAGEAFDAVIDGDDFAQVALIANKDLKQTPAFAADGTGLDLADPQGFAREAFALTSDNISDVKQLGDAYYLMRVVEKMEPETLPLETVKADIAASLKTKKQVDAARTKAQEMIDGADKAGAIAALAQANGLEVKTSPLFTRNQAIPGLAASRPVVEAAFGLDADTSLYPGVVETGQRFYLIGFNTKEVPAVEKVEGELEQVKHRIAGVKQQQNYLAWLQDLRSKASIEINQEFLN